MPAQVASAPAATLPRGDSGGDRTLPRGGDRGRARRGRSDPPPDLHRDPIIHRDPPPRDTDELERQAQEIIRQLDSVQCDVHATPYPVHNGLRQQPPRLVARRGSGNVGFGSLDRLALRHVKNNKNNVKYLSANTLPTTPRAGKIADSDKNNLIKAESLKREKVGHFNAKKVDGLEKPRAGSYPLNNVNILQKGEKGEMGGGRFNNQRRGSGLINGNHDDIPTEKYSFNKYGDLGQQQHEKPRTLVHPIKRMSSSELDAHPPKVVDSSSQTPSGFSTGQPSSDVVYSQVMHERRPAAPEPPVRPERAPAVPYRPRGFSYIGRRDAELIERAQTVEDRSRYIIEKIARERSRSPDKMWSSQRVSGSISPPPPVLPEDDPGRGAPPRGRYGTSIVMIGGDTPPPRPPPPVEPPHYQAPRGGAPALYSVPRRMSDNVVRQPRDRDNNVIRLSVSGSHTSSGGASPTERRRGDRRSYSHEPTPPTPRRDHRSKSSSPDRYFYGMDEERGVGRREATTTTTRRVKRPAPRRPTSREPSVERRRPVNGAVANHSEAARAGTLDKTRRRQVDNRERSHEPPREQHASDKKKKIKIKFIYDDTRDEPSDVRLAKYTEYRGSDEAASASPPPTDPDRPHDVVQIDIQDGHRLKQEKMLRQRDKFLAHFLEGGRPESSERRDGRRISPGQQSYDKDLHGVWSSLDEEDQITARHQRSEKTTKLSNGNTKVGNGNLNNHVNGVRDRQRISLSSEDDSRPRRTSRERSSSPAVPAPVKKRNWFSSTLSRLDFKSRKQNEAKAGRPVGRVSSQTGPRPAPPRVREAAVRESVAREAAARRETRSGSRDSRSGSREPAAAPPRRVPGRTPSFSQRYLGDSDASGENGGRRPVVRRRGSGTARPPQSLTSSVNSSDPETTAPGASRVSGSSSRSVFLHATTVADIPPPDALGSGEAAPTRGSRADLSAQPPTRERRKVGRSFSLVAPFRPKQPKEIVYENNASQQQANGRPPRPPQRARRGSRDSLLDQREAKPRQPVARSVSMPKDTRPAGFFRGREKTAR